MLQAEFENLAGEKVTVKKFGMIDTVYLYFPGIETHQQIVDIYKAGGMLLIKVMLERSLQIRRIKHEINVKKAELEELTRI